MKIKLKTKHFVTYDSTGKILSIIHSSDKTLVLPEKSIEIKKSIYNELLMNIEKFKVDSKTVVLKKSVIKLR